MKRTCQKFCFYGVSGILGIAFILNGLAYKRDPDIYVTNDNIVQDPWLTGPLLAGAGVTIPKGHTNIEPYLFVFDTFAVYTHDWNTKDIPNIKALNPTLIVTQGLARRLDFEAVIPYEVNYVQDQSFDDIGDIYLLFGIQAIRSETWPNLRITVGEVFPSGNYDNLNANRAGADAVGAGAYQTNITLNFQKSIKIYHGRTFRSRLNLTYIVPTDVDVHGFNAHTGILPLDGKVTLGNRFNAVMGFEYTITQRWVPAIDVQYQYQASSKYQGFHHYYKTTRVSGTSGSSASISLAPALEYNFSSSLGVIAGTWFTVAGRNANDFATAVVAINYYC